MIDAIFVGQPKTLNDERGEWRSSIYRDRVEGPVQVLAHGLAGDKATQPYHGGLDSAICVHLLDHYRFWNEHYGLNLTAGNVGENFTLDPISEDQVCAGDVVRVGSALVQVSGPRVPCANQARRVGRTDWVKLTLSENRTGFYLRVLEPGVVQAGDSWTVEERLNPDGSIAAINRCYNLDFDPELALRLSRMPGLGEWWQDRLRTKLEKQNPTQRRKTPKKSYKEK
jgi:MOSC domain-containing protein YiiM